jgi:hypothetical protein
MRPNVKMARLGILFKRENIIDQLKALGAPKLDVHRGLGRDGLKNLGALHAGVAHNCPNGAGGPVVTRDGCGVLNGTRGSHWFLSTKVTPKHPRTRVPRLKKV